jgi:hypothetical protein
MGARPEDYARAAPRKSYIHVDDFSSPAALAEYLKKLDADDAAYNEYFAWKGTGEFMNTFFFCRLCAMLHDPARPRKEYVNLTKWWRLDAMCRKGSWNNHTSTENARPNSHLLNEIAKEKAAIAASIRRREAAAAAANDVSFGQSNYVEVKRKRRGLVADDLVRDPVGDKFPVLL